MLCRKQLAELRPQIPRFREAGADLAVVGTGAPHFAKALQEELDLGGVRVFSDKTRRAFDLAGFRRGLSTLLRPKAVWNYLRAFLSGYAPRELQGDALQQGGVLLILPGGGVAFDFGSEASGDAPLAEDILAALHARNRTAAREL